MDTTAIDLTYEELDPVVEWSHSAEADIVKISLPGFKKEEVQTQLYSNGCVRARGKRRAAAGGAAGSKWIRFQKDLPLPPNCDVDGIRAKFAGETLTVTLPKKRPTAPPHSSPPEQAPAATEEEEEEEAPAGEAAEQQASGRRPIAATRWALVLVAAAAAFLVGVAAYLWRKSRSVSAGAGVHGPAGEVGAASYFSEM
ncbi:hypothetical protein ACP4OV_008638 [Aristida adscensionis]